MNPTPFRLSENLTVPLTGVHLRPAGAEDAAPLFQSCFATENQHRYLFRFKQSIQEQARGRRLHLLAELEQQLVGTGKLIRLPGKAEIADLLVASSWRGRGLGTFMIQHMVAVAAQWGYAEVEIGALRSNERALALYRRLGFKEARELNRPGREPVLILCRQLTQSTPTEHNFTAIYLT